MKISAKEQYRYIYFKINDKNVQKTLSLIKDELNNIRPDIPFLYSFIDEEIESLYENEKRYGRMFGLFHFSPYLSHVQAFTDSHRLWFPTGQKRSA